MSLRNFCRLVLLKQSAGIPGLEHASSSLLVRRFVEPPNSWQPGLSEPLGLVGRFSLLLLSVLLIWDNLACVLLAGLFLSRNRANSVVFESYPQTTPRLSPFGFSKRTGAASGTNNNNNNNSTAAAPSTILASLAAASSMSSSSSTSSSSSSSSSSAHHGNGAPHSAAPPGFSSLCSVLPLSPCSHEATPRNNNQFTFQANCCFLSQFFARSDTVRPISSNAVCRPSPEPWITQCGMKIAIFISTSLKRTRFLAVPSSPSS